MNGIASKLGIATQSLTDLLTGKVANDVASKLSTSTAVLQDFVEGQTPASLVWMIGGPPEDLQRLRDRIGREGAIGLLIGLLAGKSAL